jgi:hypothetical protein
MTDDDKALVPAEEPSGGSPIHRDGQGLMLEQRRFLQELVIQGSFRKACKALDFKEHRIRRWLREDSAFKDAYDDLFGPEDLEVSKKEMHLLAAKAAGLYEDALEAIRLLKVNVQCPHCKEKFDLDTSRPDWRIRMRAAETILKVAKLLQETKEIKGTMLNVQLTGDEILALTAYKAGMYVPEAVLARLRERGIIV